MMKQIIMHSRIFDDAKLISKYFSKMSDFIFIYLSIYIFIINKRKSLHEENVSAYIRVFFLINSKNIAIEMQYLLFFNLSKIQVYFFSSKYQPIETLQILFASHINTTQLKSETHLSTSV